MLYTGRREYESAADSRLAQEIRYLESARDEVNARLTEWRYGCCIEGGVEVDVEQGEPPFVCELRVENLQFGGASDLLPAVVAKLKSMVEALEK